MKTFQAPKNVRELVEFLTDHSDVVMYAPNNQSFSRKFLRFENGFFYFENKPDGKEGGFPLVCGKTGYETGISFEKYGFSVEMMGNKFHYKYIL